MAAIAQLKALLGIDNAQYKAGVRDSESVTKRFQSSLASIGRTLGVAFSAGAVFSFARRMMAWASDLSIAARNVGLLTSEMIALNRVAIQSGLEVNDMQRIVARLQSELYNAANGSKEARKKFEALNLSVRDLVGMDPAAQLRAVARAALDVGIPLQTLTELFGERLGPRAMVALRDIAENGLPAVDRALGEQADKLEALGSRWAKYWDEAKTHTLKFVNWLGEKHEVMTDWLAGMWEGVSEEGLKKHGNWAGFKGGAQAVREGKEQRAKRLEDTRAQRDQERKDTASQLVKMFDQSNKPGVAGADAAGQVEAWKADQKLQARLQGINERFDTAISRLMEAPMNLTGRDIRRDSMASVGGLVGSSRVGVAVADKILQKAIETNRRDEERLRLERERTEDARRAADALSGGGT
jgi:hypothetical protein